MKNISKLGSEIGQALVAFIVGIFALLIVIVIVVAVMTARGGGHDSGGNVGGYPDCDRGDQIEHDTDCGYSKAEHKNCKKALKAKRTCSSAGVTRKPPSAFKRKVQSVKDKRAVNKAQRKARKAQRKKR